MDELFPLPTPYQLPKLKRLPLREQPAYRLSHNPEACNLVELLAVLVGGSQQIEIAEALLERFGSVRRLQQSPVEAIEAIPGIGHQIALRLVAALALTRKTLEETQEERTAIHCPADAAGLVHYEMSLREQEYLVVMLLDTRNRVMDIVEAYHGSINSSQVRVAEIYKPAIQRNAAGILLIHNHPSGDESPSPDDIAVTRAIHHAGQLLDIDLVDHIVLGSNGRYTSLKERNLGFDGKLSEGRSSYRLGEDEVIYTYTRAQALEDGVLIDVSQMAAEAGFRLPTVITADLHATLTPNPYEQSLGQSYEGRLWDALFLANFAARRAIPQSQTAFEVGLAVCPNEGSQLRTRSLHLWLVIGPGDEGEPVLTLGFPGDF